MKTLERASHPSLSELEVCHTACTKCHELRQIFNFKKIIIWHTFPSYAGAVGSAGSAGSALLPVSSPINFWENVPTSPL